ncbi:MAG: helix-turn-helix domain-containing protein [Cytophagales bacterium]
MEINLRVNQLIEKLGYNKSSFAAKIGVSQPIITHITTGRNNPGLEVIQKILTNCPEINPEWLLLERGEMILNNQLKQKIITSLLSDINDSIIKAENELSTLKDKAELLKKMILE